MNDNSQELLEEISTSTKMSNDAIQLVDVISTSKEMDDWVVQIGARPNPDVSHATRLSMDSNIERYPSIFGNWQCWDDFGASFLTEIQKWQLVSCMTHCFGLNVRSYLEYMQQKVDLAWSYYRGVDEQFRAENGKRFIEHLLVNSCFLIFGMILLSGKKDLKDIWFEIINKYCNLSKDLTAKDIQTMADFILLEPMRTCCYTITMNYQIPWFVVEAIYTKLSNSSKLFVIPIHKIAYLFCRGFHPAPVNKINRGGTVPEGGFKHLLHILHWSRTPDGKYQVDRTNKWIGRFHIPSATELQLSQTTFIKDEGGSIDVSYCDGRISGVMQLAPLYLLDYSTKLYESLLIFERGYGLHCGRPFSSNVICMASLLKTEADVRVLRASDIIPSTSFDDKDVLHWVQELKNIIPDNLFVPNELVILEKKVMAHYQRSAYRVYGDFKRRYCSNPWITISVIGGFLIFVLTFIQTVLSFIQTKYSVLSYKKQ